METNDFNACPLLYPTLYHVGFCSTLTTKYRSLSRRAVFCFKLQLYLWWKSSWTVSWLHAELCELKHIWPKTMISIHSVGPPSANKDTTRPKKWPCFAAEGLICGSVRWHAGAQEKLGDYERLPLLPICLTTPRRGRKWVVAGTHACTPSVCSIHHESQEALGDIQGYLVSPCGVRLPRWQDFATERVVDLFPSEPRPVLGSK